MTPQSGILPEAGSAALFLILNLADTPEAQSAALRQCREFPAMILNLARQEPASALAGVVAFGADFWDRIAPHDRPSGLKSFQALGSGELQAPATGGDIFVHIHSRRHDLNLLLARQLLAPLRSCVEVLDEVHCFRYLDSRDLTGFIDGTENPEGDERAGAALIENGPFAGGSFVLAQKYVHQLRKWETLPVREQERVIGRTKPDSIELEDDVKPPSAHISRVVIEENGEELEILRHSLPYGRVSGDMGLFFAAYSRDITIYDRMLARMFGMAGDGLHDSLMDFSRPRSGAYFFAPSLEVLGRLGQ